MARRALITGGSAGLGEAIARQFSSKLGIVCAINYNSNSERAESLVNELNPGSVAIKADVSSRDECHRLVRETIQKLGGLDIIVSNAGWTKPAPFPDLNLLTEADWDKTWAYNVKSHLWLLQAAQPTFNENPNGGQLLITSSVAGTRASGSSMAYSVTKSAAIHLGLCLAKAAAPKTRVNTVSPSMLKTEWSERTFSKEKKEAHIKGNALKKMTDVEDVAKIFVMLAENESMTGENINISCGITLV